MLSLPKIAARMSRTALLGSVALGVGGFALTAGPAQANSDQTKVERLERQVELLIQQMEELKANQQQQQQEITTQQGQIDIQREEVAALPSTTLSPANVATGGDFPGSFKLPGSDTSIKIGGYIKADLIYDVGSDLGDSFVFSSIPADGSTQDNRKGNFRAHARQTRINIKTVTPTKYGDAVTFWEGDFFSSGGNEILSNSSRFRIRHAYGSLGPVLVGQTWSNFMYLDAYPDTLDFFGPVGLPFIRQAQVRVTLKPTENLTVSVSLENSEFTGLAAGAGANDSVGTLGGTRRGGDDLQFGIDTLPDFTARVTYADDWGSFSVSGVGRLLDVDSGGVDHNGDDVDDSTFGGGVLVAGVLNVGTLIPALGDDYFVANFTWGDGIGRYIINGFNQDAFLDDGGNLNSIETWGVAASYTHYWSDNLRSNVVYGHYEVVDTFANDVTESLDSIHVNLMWKPTPRIQFGVEWIYGARDFTDSSLDNESQRVQFSGQFFF